VCVCSLYTLYRATRQPKMQQHQTTTKTRLTIQKQRAADKLRLRLYKIQVVRVCVFFLTASRKKLIKKTNFSLPDARAHTQYYVSLVRDGRGRSEYRVPFVSRE